MLKEIFEQPQTINNSFSVDKDALEKVASKFLDYEQSFFVGVGTTYYVSMIGTKLTTTSVSVLECTKLTTKVYFFFLSISRSPV